MGYKIIVKVKDGNLEKALKEYKRKFQSQAFSDPWPRDWLAINWHANE